jgi:S-adenosylmethionine hydrolase
MSVITLTTDFGESSPYVAVMKGVILSINPAARIIDLSHEIGPQDIRHGSYFLATAVPYFPKGTIHVSVVDPGVGTERAILLAEVAGQFALAPENGLLTALLERHPPTGLWRLTESQFWRPTVSATFHGRDIFAPVAAHLALEPIPSRFGVPVAECIRLPGQPFNAETGRLLGCIQFVDRFGNLISNIPVESVPASPRRIAVGKSELADVKWVRTYGEANVGEVVALTSSDGLVEIAVVNGSAAQALGIAAGATIEILR